MSRDLPARPHLDHLKKQAKALLPSLRHERAEATLADALHVLASEYGFASWPKLKAHVQALPLQDVAATAEASGAGGGAGGQGATGAPGSDAPSPRGPFHRFTDASKQALFFSRYEATTLGRRVIAPEHVLLGVIRAAKGVSRTVFAAAGVTLDDARAAIAAVNAPPEPIIEPVEVPFASPTTSLFHAAADEADRLGHADIATVHIVLALLREPGTVELFLRGKHIAVAAVRNAARKASAAELQ